MVMDYKRFFENKEEENIFIKNTAKNSMISSAEKVALNRKGNILFNSGEIEQARRIYLTTGYSDGLIRVGDYYRSQGRIMDALHMYWIAPDKKKAESIVMQLSVVIQGLLNEKEQNNE
jgi:hypothetical protein